MRGKTSSVPCTYTRVSYSYADLIFVHLNKQSNGTIWKVWQTLYPRSKLWAIYLSLNQAELLQ